MNHAERLCRFRAQPLAGNDLIWGDALTLFEFGAAEDLCTCAERAAVADRRADEVGVRPDDAALADGLNRIFG